MEKDMHTDYNGKMDAVQVAKIRSVGLFCTVVLTALVLGACVLGAVYIYQNGQDVMVPAADCPRCETEESAAKMMDADMEKDRMTRMEDGTMIMEQLSYNYESNTLLIHTPGNFSDFSAATIALDYDKSLIFVNIYDQNACLAFPWSNQIAEKAEEFMTNGQNDGEIIDLAAADVTTMRFVADGLIPTDYFRSTNDMTIGALCAGRDVYWLQDTALASRLRRWRVEIHFCVFGVQVDVVISG